MPQTPEERNKLINKLSLDLWDVVTHNDLDETNKGSRVWELLHTFYTSTHNNAIQMAMGKVPEEHIISGNKSTQREFFEGMGHNTAITQMNKGLSELIIE